MKVKNPMELLMFAARAGHLTPACPQVMLFEMRGCRFVCPETFMEHSKDSTALRDRSITVVLDDHESVKQPNDFRVCPLGIQLYSPRKFSEFEILEFTISIPGSNGRKTKTFGAREW